MRCRALDTAAARTVDDDIDFVMDFVSSRDRASITVLLTIVSLGCERTASKCGYRWSISRSTRLSPVSKVSRRSWRFPFGRSLDSRGPASGGWRTERAHAVSMPIGRVPRSLEGPGLGSGRDLRE